MRAEERRVTIVELRGQGLTLAQIAQRLGLSRSWVSHIASEKSLASTRRASRALKERYRGTCRSCGSPTTGCNGPGTAPELCQACYRDANRAAHGTASAYTRGCRCDPCRTANTEKARAYRARKREKAA